MVWYNLFYKPKNKKNITMQIFNCIKHTIVNAVPSSMTGDYHSNNSYYHDMVSKYYPNDGIIDIGSMRADKLNYGRDISTVF
ncbi:hypothetical protein HYT91_00970 [Candidatus Pacearchaeota archaeon]|nr:hypothetical protein [Candidatus Pacearchaeota archaeon]